MIIKTAKEFLEGCYKFLNYQNAMIRFARYHQNLLILELKEKLKQGPITVETLTDLEHKNI